MPKVLVVDDAAFMRLALKTILERNGFQIVGEAENGAVALKMYQEYKPDLVTMDITMPVLDGIQSLKAIRQYDPKAKVIIVSAMGQEGMIKEAIASGAKSFIIKPFKEGHVIETLTKIATA
ncbi:response regulator [Mobilitalea sibirica]|uniref:Stage 0 sporulation protein A homolog n=1 Tax=Mobilitalea sibirica TaxID=1462919 RepID=A0A8J7HBH7_9FIRM|nr:response regulator [Mobilitalea sibirica]MBH1941111.1 response regulator [Mobilitalea sibirica]